MRLQKGESIDTYGTYPEWKEMPTISLKELALGQYSYITCTNTLVESACVTNHVSSSTASPALAASLKENIIFLTKTDTLAPKLKSTDLKSISKGPWTKKLPPSSSNTSQLGGNIYSRFTNKQPNYNTNQLQILQEAGKYSSGPWSNWVLPSLSYSPSWNGCPLLVVQMVTWCNLLI